ncbi:MAG: AAA family ATPase [Bacteroidales bacterium]|nr:AAA family ATPase [Bacteroidales bacterium]
MSQLPEKFSFKENFKDKDKALYISLDNLWFASHNIMDLVDYHNSHEGTHIFIDEVHYYDNWQTVIWKLGF